MPKNIYHISKNQVLDVARSPKPIIIEHFYLVAHFNPLRTEGYYLPGSNNPTENYLDIFLRQVNSLIKWFSTQTRLKVIRNFLASNVVIIGQKGYYLPGSNNLEFASFC